MANKCETEWRPEFDRDYDALRDGMFVCGADGEMIGEVDKIYVKPGEKTGHFLVKKGRLVDHDLYIPIDSVKAVDRDNVFLECASAQCVKEQWVEPPTGEVEKQAVYLNLAEESPEIFPNETTGEVSEYHLSEVVDIPDAP